jgi:hypothetical protein
LQTFADDTGLTLTVCHYPPGTGKWNKIEHRMFCHITKNWRCRPLETHEVILNLLSNTSTANGLTIYARLDTKSYPLGVKVSKTVFASLNIEPNRFHGDCASGPMSRRARTAGTSRSGRRTSFG